MKARFTKDEEIRFVKMYPTSTKQDLQREFPDRKMATLYCLANRRGLKKKGRSSSESHPASLKNIPHKLNNKTFTQNEIVVLRNMLEDEIPSVSLCLEFKRSLDVLLREARKYNFQTDYLTIKEDRVIEKQVEKKEIILDLDIVLKVNSVSMVMVHK